MIMLTICEYRKTWSRVDRSFYESKWSYVYACTLNTLHHLQSKERLGEVCALRCEVCHLFCCC